MCSVHDVAHGWAGQLLGLLLLRLSENSGLSNRQSSEHKLVSHREEHAHQQKLGAQNEEARVGRDERLECGDGIPAEAA